MNSPLRAIYKNGQLHLLDPVDLVENQEVKLMILDERAAVRAALGDLVANLPLPDDSDFDETALAEEIEAGFAGITLSDVIIEERQEGI